MKVIKYGMQNLPVREHHYECPTCRCLFAYDERDVFNGIDYDAIRCPGCGKIIRLGRRTKAFKIFKFIFKCIGITLAAVFGIIVLLLIAMIKSSHNVSK